MERVSRYRELAADLRARIAAGEFPLGSLLPTELELCRANGVSRHTARDALRLLQEGGLVERRQGAGTTVVATASPSAFVQPLGGVQELMQYASDAKLVVQSLERRALRPTEADRLDVPVEQDWLVVDGLRRAPGGEVLAGTTIYVPPAYAEIESEVAGYAEALQTLIIGRWGVQIRRIEQEICAETLDPRTAKALSVEPGTAALRTLRRYYDEGDHMVVASDSRHHAGRFVYQMTYRREG